MIISSFISSLAMGSGALLSPKVMKTVGFCVLHTPCLAPLMCPSCVSSNSGKYFCTLRTVMRGQELYLPCVIAFSQVYFGRCPATACRYDHLSNTCMLSSDLRWPTKKDQLKELKDKIVLHISWDEKMMVMIIAKCDAEDLAAYLISQGVLATYIHSSFNKKSIV